VLGLLPILWSTGVGSDLMKPIAAPIVGGMITSTIHVLIVTPVIFYILKVRALRRGTLRLSSMTRPEAPGNRQPPENTPEHGAFGVA
jgi:Cu(I)/Ag(I) efflux system membrane protein CusA/SilA